MCDFLRKSNFSKLRTDVLHTTTYCAYVLRFGSALHILKKKKKNCSQLPPFNSPLPKRKKEKVKKKKNQRKAWHMTQMYHAITKHTHTHFFFFLKKERERMWRGYMGWGVIKRWYERLARTRRHTYTETTIMQYSPTSFLCLILSHPLSSRSTTNKQKKGGACGVTLCVCVCVCAMGKKKKAKKSVVRLYRTGYQQTPIHRCDPTTARHGDFCLLCFHPGPVRLSLDNLDPRGSPQGPISMPGLAWTPDRHGTPADRGPALKPFPLSASK